MTKAPLLVRPPLVIKAPTLPAPQDVQTPASTVQQQPTLLTPVTAVSKPVGAPSLSIKPPAPKVAAPSLVAAPKITPAAPPPPSKKIAGSPASDFFAKGTTSVTAAPDDDFPDEPSIYDGPQSLHPKRKSYKHPWSETFERYGIAEAYEPTEPFRGNPSSYDAILDWVSGQAMFPQDEEETLAIHIWMGIVDISDFNIDPTYSFGM